MGFLLLLRIAQRQFSSAPAFESVLPFLPFCKFFLKFIFLGWFWILLWDFLFVQDLGFFVLGVQLAHVPVLL